MRRPETIPMPEPDRDALGDELEFLLASIDDLDRELAAGDLTSEDHRVLVDGYTARSAQIIRVLEADAPAQRRVRQPGGLRRKVVAITAVLAVAVGLGWIVSASSGQRLPGQEMTGFDPRDESTRLLAQARAVSLASPEEAAALYGLVLELDPDNVEALTYRGWTLALAAVRMSDVTAASRQLDTAVDLLISAIETDPTYADPYCFLGIVQFRFAGDANGAAPLVDGCLASNPPAEVRDLVQALATDIAAAQE